MIATDEDALICDLAETYHIYDYRRLPANTVAVFCVGLRDNSRIKLAMSEQKVSTDTLLLAGIWDRLSFLVWAQTKDGQKNQNRPQSMLDAFISKPKPKEEVAFVSGEEFMKFRNQIVKGGN